MTAPLRELTRVGALAVLFILAAGCVKKATPAPVAPPDPAARLTRPQTPDELFGAPRPKLPEAVVHVLDALWERQLQVHRLEIRVSIEELDDAGNPRADKRPLTRYVAWDERYGYRLFATGEGYICDGTEHTDLSLGRKTPCPEGGFHAKVAPIFEAEPLEASRLELLVRQLGTKTTDGIAIAEGIEGSTNEVVVTLANGGSDGRSRLTLRFRPELDHTGTYAQVSDYLFAVSRQRPTSRETITSERWSEKAPHIGIAEMLDIEHWQLDPVTRREVVTRYRRTLVDFVVNGPSNPALFLPGIQPPQPSIP